MSKPPRSGPDGPEKGARGGRRAKPAPVNEAQPGAALARAERESTGRPPHSKA